MAKEILTQKIAGYPAQQKLLFMDAAIRQLGKKAKEATDRTPGYLCVGRTSPETCPDGDMFLLRILYKRGR